MTNLFKEIQIMVLRMKSGTSIERNFYWMSKSSSILKFHYFLKSYKLDKDCPNILNFGYIVFHKI